jgi:hypothetical protein
MDDWLLERRQQHFENMFTKEQLEEYHFFGLPVTSYSKKALQSLVVMFGKKYQQANEDHIKQWENFSNF